ncbi:hypothetical protein MXB_1525, partial [Myxobolus squamalis]
MQSHNPKMLLNLFKPMNIIDAVFFKLMDIEANNLEKNKMFETWYDVKKKIYEILTSKITESEYFCQIQCLNFELKLVETKIYQNIFVQIKNQCIKYSNTHSSNSIKKLHVESYKFHSIIDTLLIRVKSLHTILPCFSIKLMKNIFLVFNDAFSYLSRIKQNVKINKNNFSSPKCYTGLQSRISFFNNELDTKIKQISNHEILHAENYYALFFEKVNLFEYELCDDILDIFLPKKTDDNIFCLYMCLKTVDLHEDLKHFKEKLKIYNKKFLTNFKKLNSYLSNDKNNAGQNSIISFAPNDDHSKNKTGNDVLLFSSNKITTPKPLDENIILINDLPSKDKLSNYDEIKIVNDSLKEFDASLSFRTKKCENRADLSNLIQEFSKKYSCTLTHIQSTSITKITILRKVGNKIQARIGGGWCNLE